MRKTLTVLCLIIAAVSFAEMRDAGVARSLSPRRVDKDTNGKISTMESTQFASCELWMPFSYDDTGNYYDLSTNKTDGTQSTASARPTYSTGNGGCFDFDGSADLIYLGSSVPFGDDQSGTFCAWFKADQVGVDNEVLLGRGHDSGAKSGWRVRINTDSRPELHISTANGTGRYTLNLVVSAGTWYHIALESDGTAWTGYINGTKRTPYSSSGPVGEWFGDSTFGANVKYSIGSGRYAGSYGAYFDGKIDDIRVYSSVLSSNEIYAIYNSTKGDH